MRLSGDVSVVSVVPSKSRVASHPVVERSLDRASRIFEQSMSRAANAGYTMPAGIHASRLASGWQATSWQATSTAPDLASPVPDPPDAPEAPEAPAATSASRWLIGVSMVGLALQAVRGLGGVPSESSTVGISAKLFNAGEPEVLTFSRERLETRPATRHALKHPVKHPVKRAWCSDEFVKDRAVEYQMTDRIKRYWDHDIAARDYLDQVNAAETCSHVNQLIRDAESLPSAPWTPRLIPLNTQCLNRGSYADRILNENLDTLEQRVEADLKQSRESGWPHEKAYFDRRAVSARVYKKALQAEKEKILSLWDTGRRLVEERLATERDSAGLFEPNSLENIEARLEQGESAYDILLAVTQHFPATNQAYIKQLLDHFTAIRKQWTRRIYTPFVGTYECRMDLAFDYSGYEPAPYVVKGS
jgi:hypothetical protein